MAIHGIAADRIESPHGTFNAFAMTTLLGGLFTEASEERTLRAASDRLAKMPSWPFRSVTDLYARRGAF